MAEGRGVQWQWWQEVGIAEVILLLAAAWIRAALSLTFLFSFYPLLTDVHAGQAQGARDAAQAQGLCKVSAVVGCGEAGWGGGTRGSPGALVSRGKAWWQGMTVGDGTRPSHLPWGPQGREGVGRV